MITPTMLFRRSLMLAIGGAGSLWFTRKASCIAINRECHHVLSGADALAALCEQLDCPRAIGEACLRAVPSIASEKHLMDAILSCTGSSDMTFPSVHAFAELIRDHARKDFCSGRIVAVDGWLLSSTEVQLYALAALPFQISTAGDWPSAGVSDNRAAA
jgi:hypothetical protein